MKKQSRFLKSVIAASQSEKIDLPFSRQHRAAMSLRRKAVPALKRA